MGIKSKYSQHTRRRIRKMTEVGILDGDISEKLSAGRFFVAQITTKYWKDKMLKKVNV